MPQILVRIWNALRRSPSARNGHWYSAKMAKRSSSGSLLEHLGKRLLHGGLLILTDAALGALVILALGVVNRILHWSWLGIKPRHIAIVEEAHFWVSLGMFVAFPILSLAQIMLGRARA